MAQQQPAPQRVRGISSMATRRAVDDLAALASERVDVTFESTGGVTVGRLVADNVVQAGLQQFSGLTDVDGVTVLGPMPRDCAIVSRFDGAVATASAQPDAATAVLEVMASPEADDIKRRNHLATPAET